MVDTPDDFRLFFDLHPQPMWVVDRETTRFLSVNRATCEVYGWTPDEFLTMTLSDIRVPEPQLVLDTMLKLGDQELGQYARIAHHRTKDGRVIEVEVTIRRIAIGGRQVALAVITNLTAAKDMERRLRLLLEHSVDGIATVDAQGVITYMSPGGARTLGYTPEEQVGQRAAKFIHPDDLKHVGPALPGAVVVATQRALHKDGSWRWIESVSTNLTHEPTIRAHVSNFRDITERHQAAENFRTLIELLPTATLVHRHGHVVYVNAATITTLGYERADELLGRAVLELIHPDDREAVICRIAATERTGTSRISEVRMLRRDGSTAVIEARGVLLDFDGKPSHVAFANDLTERHALFTRMATADRLLSVGTLAAGVAHEINNPLAYVTSNLELIATEMPKLRAGEPTRLDPTALQGLIADAQEGAARVSAIVRDLRTLARPEDSTSSPVDVLEVLALATKMTHNEIRHRARVVHNYDPEIPPVYANSSRLGQVFLNLLVNAAHSIDDGHVDDNEIGVRVTADPDMVYVEITDTGAGIPVDILPQIFDPFFTTKPHGVGVGLGLSISDRIVASFNGTITVTSKVGEGSTFRVALPVAPRQTTMMAAVGQATAVAAPSRILMIDDEAAVGRSIRLLLSPEHEVITVTDAREALGKLTEGAQFDVILCDLMMPDMSGMEFYNQLAERCAEWKARVVFMTGGAFTAHAREFLAKVATPYLEKPFTEQALRAAIAAVTG